MNKTPFQGHPQHFEKPVMPADRFGGSIDHCEYSKGYDDIDMTKTKTFRGFDLYEFTDIYNASCTLQKSSLASDDNIWLGLTDADPQIMASKAQENGVHTDETTGWVPYPVPQDVFISTRMHLSRDLVKALLPALMHFAKTGSIDV